MHMDNTDNSQDNREREENIFIPLYHFHLLTNIQIFNYSFAPEMTIDMSKNVGRGFVLQNYTLTGTKVSLVKIRGEQMVRQYSHQGLRSKSG